MDYVKFEQLGAFHKDPESEKAFTRHFTTHKKSSCWSGGGEQGKIVIFCAVSC